MINFFHLAFKGHTPLFSGNVVELNQYYFGGLDPFTVKGVCCKKDWFILGCHFHFNPKTVEKLILYNNLIGKCSVNKRF